MRVWIKTTYMLKTYGNFLLSHSRRMDMILHDTAAGLSYRLQASPEEVAWGVIQYNPKLHGDLWEYLWYEGQLYANNPVLDDWDSDIVLWDASQMGQWPFGYFPTEEEQRETDALQCLELLDLLSMR